MVASLCYCNNNYWAVSWTDCCNEIRPRRTSSLKGSLHLKPNTVKSNYFSPGNWGPQIFPTLPSLLLCNYTVLYQLRIATKCVHMCAYKVAKKLLALFDCCLFKKKLRCHREMALMSFNISLSHSRSQKFIQHDTLQYDMCKSL